MTAAAAEKAAAKATLRGVVDRDEFVGALRHVAWAVPRRAPLPVLAGVMLSAATGTLDVLAHDYVTGARHIVTAPGARGEALVEARRLAAMVRALPRGCDVAFAAEGQALRISGGGVDYTLPALPADDYPEPKLPERNASLIVVLEAAEFQSLARVCAAAGRDETLPVLTAVSVEAGPDGLTFAATDRYRLAVATGDGPGLGTEPVQRLVPARLIQRAAALFKTGHVSLTVDSERVDLSSGPAVLGSAVLAGAYPKYRSLFPAELPTTVTLAAAELAEAVHQVGVAIDRHTPLRVLIEPGKVTLRGGADDDPTYSPTAVKVVDADVAGVTPVNVALNPSYLLDMLPKAPEAMVRIQLPRQVERAGHLSVASPIVAQDPADDSLRQLLMPVRMFG